MAEERKFSVAYFERPDKPTITANGAYGGPALDGSSVIMHLYAEYASIPTIAVHDIGDGGVIDLMSGQLTRRADVTREVTATIVLSPDVAVAVATFLKDKAQKAKAIAAARKKRRKTKATKKSTRKA